VQLLERVKASCARAAGAGFAGAPFTVAAYCIGTGRTRGDAPLRPGTAGRLDRLLDRLGEATVHFLGELAARGGDAYQLFDSWAGLLSRTNTALGAAASSGDLRGGTVDPAHPVREGVPLPGGDDTERRPTSSASARSTTSPPPAAPIPGSSFRASRRGRPARRHARGVPKRRAAASKPAAANATS